MTMREKTLDARLSGIVSLIKKGESVADIGSDHAYIPMYLIKNGICEKVLVTDIRQGPLDNAERNFRRFGIADKLKRELCDGIPDHVPAEYSTVIIAGMGGLTVSGIIDRSKEALAGYKTRLILQPMTEIDALRRFLAENGFDIKSELCRKNRDGKIYTIIEAVYSTCAEYTNAEYYLGKYELCLDPATYAENAENKTALLEKAVCAGAKDKEELLHDIKKYYEKIKR